MRRVRIIVADNDAQPSARRAGRGAARRAAVRAPLRALPGLQHLDRPQCLPRQRTGDFLAFIDDDETASAEWLVELTGGGAGDRRGCGARTSERRLCRCSTWLDAARRLSFDAAGLCRRTDPHRLQLQRPAAPGIAPRCRAPLQPRIRPDRRRGHRIFHADASRPAAASPMRRGRWSIEPVPQARARFSWLAKRRFRSGQTHGRLLGRGRAAAGLFRQVALAAAKAAYCFAAAAALAVVAQHRNRYALRGVLHIGVVVGLLGIQGNSSLWRRSAAREAQQCSLT